MKPFTIIILLLLTTAGYGQDRSFAIKTIDTLTSPYFWGRGYTKNGMKKAALFLAKELASYGVKPLDGKSFFQEYELSVNTFPEDMKLEINGIKLKPGYDFIVGPASRGTEAKGKLVKKDSLNYVDPANRILVTLENKLTWSVAREVADFTSIHIDKKAIKSTPENIKVEIDNRFIPNFKAANVSGIVKGTQLPDSIIFITAHYDHLGGMGQEVYFPGANDNASGVALLLDLARYYTNHRPAYSIGFILFSAEEAGLLGSKYFTDNPLVDLSRIRFLINLDLTGTGDEGITVVNATEFKQEFDLIRKINDEHNYLNQVNPRGKAANSDHYWFSEKKVPAFFIYTMGGIKAYHDVYDVAKTLPLSSYDNLFRLIRDYNNKLMNSK
ncbi:M28 family metallopeptidase [Pedobacter sp. SYSU D00535]|uniref:M28 family metallopeptidase n=1 Tax=Pedobacter sp. SYSU D00535 TaxID=2810308 RepID=UPI001A96E885|nr:M28 family peptidase [Pedobacter sp. SYSU D00535]